MDRRKREEWARKGITITDQDGYGFSSIAFNNNSRGELSFGEDIVCDFSGIFGRPILSGSDHATLPITFGGATVFGFCEFALYEKSLLKMCHLVFVFPQHRRQGIFKYVMTKLCDNMVFTLSVQPLELYLCNVYDGYQPVLSNITELQNLDLQERQTTKGKKWLLESYKQIGFRECVFAGSKKTFVTSLPTNLPGMVHLT